ncbi:hypothetical protein FT643_03095 [Ketobacter sp. MCCC 1A13808]|uniref:hypothetical protein n=1 Tax=Ketobacter sp. MCCC 1A13808 TaxID=2602738 RepID=UPI0012EB1FE1|nr:hypothetical protein [Ketobacter sp. MCCC 1A13808]MVF11122.1 hypothetical protein [Ketobacter sp. MCCC 1A13808]
MAGYIVGSLLMTWVLCSALNGFIEYAAIQQWLDRSKAFISMIVGVLVIAVIMVVIALWGLPESQLAKDVMTPRQLSTSTQTSIVVNVLFAVGYCAFQLRRFWDD